MGQSVINIRMDDALKRNFDYVCEQMGMNMSTAITIFATKVCREKRIPFEISIEERRKSKIMEKTKFKIFIYPEFDYDKNIEMIEEIFDDYQNAFNFLKTNYDKMQNEIWNSEDVEVQKGIPFFAIEFINPENMYRHIFIWDNLTEYEYDNERYDMSSIFSEDENMFDAIDKFIHSLECQKRIVF